MAGIREALDGAIVQAMLGTSERRRLEQRSRTASDVAENVRRLPFQVRPVAAIRSRCEVQRDVLASCLGRVATEAANGEPLTEFPHQVLLGRAGGAKTRAQSSQPSQPKPSKPSGGAKSNETVAAAGAVTATTVAVALCGCVAALTASLFTARFVWR